MYKEISDQSTIQPLFYNMSPINSSYYFPQVYYVPQEVH